MDCDYGTAMGCELGKLCTPATNIDRVDIYAITRIRSLNIYDVYSVITLSLRYAVNCRHNLIDIIS